MPRADNVNASLGFRSIMVQKSAALPAKHFDPLKSPYCGTHKHNNMKRRCNGPSLKRCLGCHFSYIFINVSFLCL